MAKSKEEIIEEMQQVAAQMIEDDLEENPDLANEYFECDCCGQNKCLAGSIQYDKYRLCNDCVLLAETGFALKKFDNIQSLIDNGSVSIVIAFKTLFEISLNLNKQVC